MFQVGTVVMEWEFRGVFLLFCLGRAVGCRETFGCRACSRGAGGGRPTLCLCCSPLCIVGVLATGGRDREPGAGGVVVDILHVRHVSSIFPAAPPLCMTAVCREPKMKARPDTRAAAYGR